jgi:hypothetical protein
MVVGEQIQQALAEQWTSLTSLDLEDCTFSIDQQQLEEVLHVYISSENGKGHERRR